ncbi:MAG: S-adenosylmethionine decarboxylase [Burkholderiales bacterium]
MQGLHLTADLRGCRCDRLWLVDSSALAAYCIAAAECSGLSAVAEVHHTFEAAGRGEAGVTATVLLAESHLCVHTWPELDAVTLDVYVCNFLADHSASAHRLMDLLLALFKPTQDERHSLVRGSIGT